MVIQVGAPAEEDLSNWGHHPDVSTLPDTIMQKAAEDDVTFVFSCQVHTCSMQDILQQHLAQMASRWQPVPVDVSALCKATMSLIWCMDLKQIGPQNKLLDNGAVDCWHEAGDRQSSTSAASLSTNCCHSQSRGTSAKACFCGIAPVSACQGDA